MASPTTPVIVSLLRILLANWASEEGITDESDFYTAAVYQHRQLGNGTTDLPQHIILQNLNAYSSAAETASRKGADIIVFPEYGLYLCPDGFKTREEARPFLENVPDPQTITWNPCSEPDAQRPMLTRLSCIAQSNNMFVVANMGDIQPCSSDVDSDCPEDGAYQYNTNVVFDRQGKLLVRYHKINLFFEEAFNTPRKKEVGIFETDFGTFATFICFDIIFGESVKVVQEKGIHNVAFPTWWLDQHPMHSAIQYHQAWAFRNQVNLLAANVHAPKLGTVGTAVYSGTRGILSGTLDQPRLIVTRVPKNPKGSKKATTVIRPKPRRQSMLSSIKLPPDYLYTHDMFTHCTLTRLTKASDKITACNNGLCCSLRYRYRPSTLDGDYYLVVFNGTRNMLNTYYLGEEYCLMVRCDSKNGTACNSFPMKTQTRFTYVSLGGNFTTSFVYPSFQQSNMALQEPHRWSFSHKRASNGIEVFPSIPLLSVNLYGRCYERDGNIT